MARPYFERMNVHMSAMHKTVMPSTSHTYFACSEVDSPRPLA